VGLACVIGLALVLLPGDPPADPVLAASGSEFVATSLSLTSRAGARPWLGIEGDDDTTGVRVETVAADSPADSSGVRTGDVIVAIDGAPLHDLESLWSAVAASGIGGRVDLTVLRDGAAHDIVVWLEPEP
jgi:S1-C subfamily serine protease